VRKENGERLRNSLKISFNTKNQRELYLEHIFLHSRVYMLSGPSKSEQVVEAQKLRISKLDSIKDLL